MEKEFEEDKLRHVTNEQTYSTRSVEVLETYPTDIDP